jgi:inner membrane protein
LDCFTTYGTQILIPFSDQRVAFNNIAVADPLYTLPFMFFLLTAAFYNRTNPQRSKWNNIGLTISSLYMIFTIVNKTRINTIFENSLIKENITYQRYLTTPTILNNILWSGIAESDSVYYYGTYSFFDAEKSFKLNVLPKNRAVVGDAINKDQTLKTLTWFSDDYYQIKRKNQDSLEYYDLRFGTFKMKSTDAEQFVFKFNIQEKPKGTFILKDQGDRPRDADFGEAFAALWNRIMGRT